MKRIYNIYKYLLIVLLSSCTTLSSPETIAGCQLADAATTTIALSHGLVEANPLLSFLGLPGILVVKFLVIPLFIKHKDSVVVQGATAVTCGIAVHNLLLL